MAKAETTQPKTYTPGELAKELDIDPKRLRAYLRSNHGRDAEAHRSRWTLDEATAQAVRERFTPSETGGADSDES